MKSVRARVGAAGLALALVSGAAACQSNVGAAASVDGQRIPESEVTKYIAPTGHSAASARQLVVEVLLKQKLYESAMSKIGARATDAQLTGLQGAAASALQAQLPPGQAGIDALGAQLGQSGYTPSLAAVLLRALELELAFGQAKKVTNAAGIVAATKALNIPVSVSPRYGSWDATNQGLGTAVSPDFLTTSPSPSPSPAA